MDLLLRDRVVLVTGGANGIGAAIVRALAEEGAITVIVDRCERSAWTLHADLQARGAKVHVVVADLSQPKTCKLAIDETILKFQRLDALVNNAGENDRVGLEHGSPGEFLASVERNLSHYYNMAHYALAALKKSRGSIVNIASKTALVGQGDTSGYAAAKGAILALTREWAVELLPFDIRVNAVVPAEVMTPMYRQWLGGFPNAQAKLGHIVSRIPLGKRMTAPEEVASAVMFLISCKSGHTTGQHVFVDGGYVHLDRAVI